MGLRGRQPRSAETTIAMGNPGHVKVPTVARTETISNGEIKAIPQPPDWLIPEAVTAWHQLAEGLVKMGMLSEYDEHLFGKYCQAVGLAIKCERELSKGTHKKLANNTHTPKPELKLAQEQWKIVEKLAPHFGLSPKHRQAQGIKLPRQDDAKKLKLNSILNGQPAQSK